MQKLTQQPSKNTIIHILVENLESTRSHQSTNFEVLCLSASSGFLQNRGNENRPSVNRSTQVPATVIECSTQAGMETLLNQQTYRITIAQEASRNLWSEARFQKFGVNQENFGKVSSQDSRMHLPSGETSIVRLHFGHTEWSDGKPHA